VDHEVEDHVHVALLRGDCGWEDIGTWGSLAELLASDGDGNVVRGLHLGIDTKGSMVFSDGGLVATLGLRDLIVVRQGDTVLVLPRAREDEMRELVAALEKRRDLDRFR
jgi:mannose-1-phosphate guanylyltransferase